MRTRSSYRTASHTVARALDAARVRRFAEHGTCVEPKGEGLALWLSCPEELPV